MTVEKLGRKITNDKQLAEEKEIARAFVEPDCFAAYQKWVGIIDALESGNAARFSDDPWLTETDRDDDEPVAT